MRTRTMTMPRWTISTWMPTDFEKFWEGQIQEEKVFACPEQKEETDKEKVYEAGRYGCF